MRNKLTIGITIGFLIGIMFSAGAIVLAGTLDPAGGPTVSTSQMYTLQQIYEQLTTGATSAKMETFTEPAAGPGTSTMFTLDEIMALTPVTHTNAATQTGVLSGTVVWGLSEDAWGVITGTRPYFPVLKTGQTVCYRDSDPFVPCECGEDYCPARVDGDLQMGFEPIPPTLRFTVISGTVTDNMTGLIWLQNAHCPGIEDPADPTGPAGRNWFTAFENVAQLNATGGMTGTDGIWRSCGDTSNGGTTHQTDWRLPNVRELNSLTNYGVDLPSLPRPHPFLNVQNRWYWTSTTHITHPDEAWFVSMWGGRVHHVGKSAVEEGSIHYRLYVWPVRGGQE